MSNKKIANELLLTTAENLTDEILFKTANNFLEDAIKSIPFASLITNSVETYTQFRILKEQKQLLAFIQEAENVNQGFIGNFFHDKNNTEIGLEILGILDQTYLEHQARMIGRTTLLFKNNNISKLEFDKYTYIITKLNNHLINLIEQLFNTSKDFKPTIQDTRNPIVTAIGLGLTASFPSPNMDLISFGFLEEVAPKSSKSPEISNYIRTKFFYNFYENIFKD